MADFSSATFRILASPPPRSPPVGQTPVGRATVSGLLALAFCPAWVAIGLGKGGFRRPRFGSWGWDVFTGRDKPELTESCLDLRFLCLAEQNLESS